MTAAPPRRSQLNPDRLEAAKAGSAEAWEAIYTELAGPVTGYLRKGGAPDPEDLCSEIFFQVARDIHRFKGNEENFRSWVFVIAHRRLIDARRAAGRRPIVVDEPLSDHESVGGDVEEEVFAQMSADRVREILEELTTDQRQVLLLRIVADLSLEETAKAMGKRVGAVKALQRRALRAAQSAIAEGRVS